MTGVIRNLTENKGYGFIRADDGKEYFFHRDDFIGFWNDLVTEYHTNTGLLLDFTPARTLKGLRAQNVSVVNWPDAAVKETL